MIITIDGPAGAGKSTAARGLAARLGFEFLDTGAMYRTVTFACLRDTVSLDNEAAITQIAQQINIDFADGKVFLDGKDVTAAIRTSEVTLASAAVAGNAAVRDVLSDLQRKLAAGRDVITEGRDQGTVVFPDAQCKFFITADPRQRAVRRQEEQKRRGEDVPLEQVLAQQEARDHRDQNRTVAPLKPAPDAIHIDTSQLTPEAVLDKLEHIARERMPGQDLGKRAAECAALSGDSDSDLERLIAAWPSLSAAARTQILKIIDSEE